MPIVQTDKLLSLVIPVFNEEAALAPLLALLGDSLAQLPVASEVVIVDDGSTDGTWARLKQVPAGAPALRLIRFTRNFGKEAAIMAGLKHSKGDAVIVLDADMQHPPGMLREMLDLWLDGEADIIDAVKTDNRNAPALDRLTSTWFNRLFRRFTGYDMRGASDYKLLDRRVVDVLVDLTGYNMFFRGTTAWLGFRHREVGFHLGPRSGGRSKWNLVSRLQLAITAITNFTSLPLHLITLVGIISLLFAIVHGGHTLYNKFTGQAVEGFTTVILLLLIFGSVITLGLGVIGAYLSKIHDEVRGRPRYLIEETLQVTPRE